MPAAWEKVRVKAQELTERHERLIDLAAEFFEQQDDPERIRVEVRGRADAIVAKAKQDAGAAAKKAGAKVQRMLHIGESRAAVAARLGLSTAAMKRTRYLIREHRRRKDRVDAVRDCGRSRRAGCRRDEGRLTGEALAGKTK
jgi:hypothetical protein